MKTISYQGKRSGMSGIFRPARRALKPLLLWLNARRVKRSEEHIAHLDWVREGAVRQIRYEHVRQAQLAEERARISKW